MHKLTLKLAVCIAALAASGTAHAGSVARIPLGQTGNTVEVSKCGDKFCFRIEKDGEAKKIQRLVKCQVRRLGRIQLRVALWRRQ